MHPTATPAGNESVWMGEALLEAARSLEHDDVPVGAVVVRLSTGEIVARAHNARERDHDPTAHAELLALRSAAVAAGTWRLTDYALVATLEPCPMCAGAAWAARVGLVVFGAADPRLNHDMDVVAGVRAEECAKLLTTFFQSRR